MHLRLGPLGPEPVAESARKARGEVRLRELTVAEKT
jgi:hypothetical protein